MLKKLSIISLLILFLPFFQTCSDKNIADGKMPFIHSPLSEEVIIKPKSEVNGKEFNLTFEELTLKKKKAINDFIELKKELTYNGYEMGFLLIQDIKNPQWILLPFAILILISCAQIILSFLEKLKAIFVLGILNICLLILPFIILYMAEFFEDIEQLKIGFYLLLFNLTIIVFESYSQLKRKNIR
jgi:hypothetical protein